MRLGRTILITLLTCFLTGAMERTFGQVYDLVVLDSESGIVGIQVNDIAQDAKGYIWIATGTGVGRYDGKAFVNYQRRDGLADNNCTSVLCDSDGKIWIGHQSNGISIIHGDSIHHITEDDGLANNEVHDIYQTTDGKIWVATFGGVSIFDGGAWSRLTIKDGLESNHTQAISQDAEGRVWIGIFGSGVNVITGKRMDLLHAGNGLVNNHVTSLYPMNDHMMIGTLGGLSIWKDGLFKNTSAMDGLSNSQVNDVTVSSNGDIWLATYNGLNRVRSTGLVRLTEENGLSNNEVLSVFNDLEGNIWLGTSKGLVRIRNLAFTHYFSTSELDVDPSSFFRDSKGTLWAANEAGGALKFANESFVRAFEDVDINDRQISSIAEDGHGNIWFGTMDFGGLFQFDGRRLYIYSDEFGLADNNINCLLKDAEGKLLIGTPNGLSEFDGAGFRTVFVSDDRSSNHITCMELGPDGTVYLGAVNGSLFRMKDGLLEEKIGINATSPIIDLVHGPMGLVIATQSDGLYLFKDDKVRSINGKQGLQVSSLRSLAVLGEQLFLGSASGLQQLSFIGDSVIVKEFKLKDGFLGATCKRGAMMADGNRIWIGTSKGITRYVPSEELPNVEKPRLMLTKLQLSYRDIDWGAIGYEVTDKGLPLNLKLHHKDNSLRFYFKGIHHRQPKGVTYKWILEGFEDNWNPPTDLEYANYPNLPPGEYTLKVIACNSVGVCNLEPLEFQFSITPPVWQRPIFYVILGIMALILTYIYVKLREQRLLEEKRILEATVEERTKELREQKEIVEEQNKHITESIDYAKNIQMAVLPSEDDMKRAFDDHFVFYRPKDTVGGDFYWVFSEGDISWAAAVDCTGHGVAGAFMSMIGTDLLNQIIIEKKIDDPAKVLDEMDKGIKLAFAQSAKEFETDQGMDMSLLRIDRKKKVIEFAGAQRPLYLICNGELVQIEGDRHSISCAEQRGASNFVKHIHHVHGNTTAYLFSDGIVDQFGGPNGKKFMIRRLREFLEETRSLPTKQQGEHLTAIFDEWIGQEYDQVDDVMLLGIRL